MGINPKAEISGHDCCQSPGRSSAFHHEPQKYSRNVQHVCEVLNLMDTEPYFSSWIYGYIKSVESDDTNDSSRSMIWQKILPDSD